MVGKRCIIAQAAAAALAPGPTLLWRVMDRPANFCGVACMSLI